MGNIKKAQKITYLAVIISGIFCSTTQSTNNPQVKVAMTLPAKLFILNSTNTWTPFRSFNAEDSGKGFYVWFVNDIETSFNSSGTKEDTTPTPVDIVLIYKDGTLKNISPHEETERVKTSIENLSNLQSIVVTLTINNKKFNVQIPRAAYTISSYEKYANQDLVLNIFYEKKDNDYILHTSLRAISDPTKSFADWEKSLKSIEQDNNVSPNERDSLLQRITSSLWQSITSVSGNTWESTKAAPSRFKNYIYEKADKAKEYVSQKSTAAKNYIKQKAKAAYSYMPDLRFWRRWQSNHSDD